MANFRIGQKAIVNPKCNYMLAGRVVYITGYCSHTSYYVEDVKTHVISTYSVRNLIPYTEEKEEKESEVQEPMAIQAPYLIVSKQCTASHPETILYYGDPEQIHEDDLIVAGQSLKNYTVHKVEKVIPIEQYSNHTYGYPCGEFVQKVDTSEYTKRVEQRKRKQELKEKIEREIAAHDRDLIYTKYADMFPEMKALVDEYKTL